MSNMSYCRFRNTLGDFQDCVDSFDEPCSPEEDVARKELYELALQLVDDFGGAGGADNLPVKEY